MPELMPMRFALKRTDVNADVYIKLFRGGSPEFSSLDEAAWFTAEAAAVMVRTLQYGSPKPWLEAVRVM